MGKGKGWHGDSAGHSRAAKKGKGLKSSTTMKDIEEITGMRIKPFAKSGKKSTDSYMASVERHRKRVAKLKKKGKPILSMRPDLAKKRRKKSRR